MHAAAFDELAADYDADLHQYPVGQRAAAIVWARLDRRSPVRSASLIWVAAPARTRCTLAARGVRVLGHRRLRGDGAHRAGEGAAARLRGRAEFQCLPIEGLGSASPGRVFDGMLSNFGALNCVPTCRAAWQRSPRGSTPGARLVWVLMGRHVPWEWGWFLLRGDRRAPGGGCATAPTGAALGSAYPTPVKCDGCCSHTFRDRCVRPLGVALPPSYAAGWLNQRPRLLRALLRLEHVRAGPARTCLLRRPLHHRGDAPGGHAALRRRRSKGLMRPASELHSAMALARLPLVTLYLSERCNSRCVSCDYWRHGTADMDLAAVRRLLPDLARLRTEVVLLSGGEPLLNPQWERDCADAARGGTEAVAADLRTVAGQARAPCRGAVRHHHGFPGWHQPDTYAAIRGLDAFDKVCEGIRAAAQAGARVTVRVTLQHANFRELPQVRRAGARVRRAPGVVPGGGRGEPARLRPRGRLHPRSGARPARSCPNSRSCSMPSSASMRRTSGAASSPRARASCGGCCSTSPPCAAVAATRRCAATRRSTPP